MKEERGMKEVKRKQEGGLRKPQVQARSRVAVSVTALPHAMEERYQQCATLDHGTSQRTRYEQKLETMTITHERGGCHKLITCQNFA